MQVVQVMQVVPVVPVVQVVPVPAERDFLPVVVNVQSYNRAIVQSA